MTTRVAVIILNFNTAKLLETMLPHLVQTQFDGDLQLIVADNGSNDQSREVVERFQEVSWLPLDKNYGYAEGYNRAIAQTDAEYMVLLNSDVEVSPDWLNPLVQYAEKNNYQALQPKILDYNQRDTFEYAGACGGFMDFLGYPFCRGRFFDHCEIDKGQYDLSMDVFWASGACLFIRKDAFEKAGGLDARLFAHMEEIDLCWRMQLMGMKIGCVPASVVYHIGGGTLSSQNAKKTYLNFRNSLVLLARYNSGVKGIFKVLFRMILDFPAAVLFASRGNFADVLAIIKAHWHFLGRLSYWLKPTHDFKPTTHAPLYPKSIVWQHYVRGVKIFNKLT